MLHLSRGAWRAGRGFRTAHWSKIVAKPTHSMYRKRSAGVQGSVAASNLASKRIEKTLTFTAQDFILGSRAGAFPELEEPV